MVTANMARAWLANVDVEKGREASQRVERIERAPCSPSPCSSSSASCDFARNTHSTAYVHSATNVYRNTLE
eukprot:4321446-Lingulodinium_polyedra.AAC.1